MSEHSKLLVTDDHHKTAEITETSQTSDSVAAANVDPSVGQRAYEKNKWRRHGARVKALPIKAKQLQVQRSP